MGAALNNQQIFIFFLACFAGIVNVLIHLSVTERMKAAAYYVICVVAAVVSSVLSVADVGVDRPAHECGLPRLLRHRVRLPLPGRNGARPRPQGRDRDPACTSRTPAVPAYRSSNLGLTTAGVAVIFAGLPMVILSCLFFYAAKGSRRSP